MLGRASTDPNVQEGPYLRGTRTDCRFHNIIHVTGRIELSPDQVAHFSCSQHAWQCVNVVRPAGLLRD
jgi:hypothetical protein